MRSNQPKHRQVRKEQRRLARAKASRAGLPSILIICEGRETEKNYIDGLRDYLRVNAAAVRIDAGDSVTDPLGLVRKAQQRYKGDRDFDRVYIVCDGDSERLIDARALAARPLRNAAGVDTQVQIIASTPCFEFWLLLHFEYCARPFRNAAEVQQAIQNHLPEYQKNDRDIFSKTAAGLDRACQWSLQLKRELQTTGAIVPDTDMSVLVDQFRQMQKT